MKKLIFSAVMYCLALSAYAQTNVDDKVFLNNFIILTSVSGDLESTDNWIYADLNVKDIVDKNVSISMYPYVNRFGEWVLSPKPTGSYNSNIMSYNTVDNELNIKGSKIDYNERKRFNGYGDCIYIIPSETTPNQDVRIEEYMRTGKPTGSFIRIKYDGKKRIIAIIPARYAREYIHIKYNADNSIVSFSTIESFNPKAYIKQKHQKVEYLWSGNNIQSIKFYQIEQSSSGDKLVLRRTIDCKVVEKNDAGLWTAMDIVEKSNLDSGEQYIKTEKYRLVREFK